MKTHIRRINFALCCGALLAGASATARGTTLLRMSLAKLSHTAEVIVRARCVANSAKWDADEIWTFTVFDTEETWRGSPPAQFMVRLLGGRVGNLTSSVHGVPRFSRGEDVVLFLEATPRSEFTVVSWQQGTFRIRVDPRTGDASVTQDSAAFATFEPMSRQFRAEGIRFMPLTEFRERVADGLRDGGRRNP